MHAAVQPPLDEHLKIRETEKKNVRWLRDINPRPFSWWAGRRDLKNIFSVGFPRDSTVNELWLD